MKKIKLSYILASVLIASLSPSIALSKDASKVEQELKQDLKQAQSLYEQKRYDEAWALLTDLMRKDPNNVDINALMFKVAGDTGRANQAIGIMLRMVALHPNDAKLRHELAKAYANAGDEASAKAELENVRTLDPSLADPGSEFDISRRAKMSQNRWERLQFSGELNAGLIYNTNVNSGLNSLGVSIGSLDLVLNNAAKKSPSIGEYLNTSFNLGYRLSEDGPWWLVGDINAYGLKYNKDVPSNNHFAWGRLGAGVRYTGEQNLVDMRIKGEGGVYDPKDYMRSLGLEASWIYAFLPQWQVISKASFEHRGFNNEYDKDGNYWYGGAYLRYLWGQDASNYVMAGGRIIGASSTKEKLHSYTGFETMLRFNVALNPRFEVAPFIGYRQQYYKDSATELSKRMGESNRRDRAMLGGAFFTYHIDEMLSTQLGWQYTHNHSNSDFYDYKQHLINLGLSWRF